MDWKAFRKAEDRLAKAFDKHEDAEDGSKKQESAKTQLVEAVREWYEARDAED